MSAIATLAVYAALRGARSPGDDPTAPGGARAPKPVVYLDDAYARRWCAGRHREGTAVPGTRLCTGCGKPWCGVHADVSRDHRCRGCRGETVLIADVTVVVRDGREMGWVA